MALHSTEALMAGFLKSSDLGPHPGYGAPHHPHHSHPHGPLPPGMPMTSLAPFGLPHGLDAVGFPQGMWGKYHHFLFIINYMLLEIRTQYSHVDNKCCVPL